MSQSISTERILGVISRCLSSIAISIRCFRSRLIIDAQTSSRFAQDSSGSGQWRAIFASDGVLLLDGVGDVVLSIREVDAPFGDALR